MGRSELQELTVAGAARTQMIKPLVGLGERHLTRGDPFEKVRAGTPNAVWIGKLLE